MLLPTLGGLIAAKQRLTARLRSMQLPNTGRYAVLFAVSLGICIGAIAVEQDTKPDALLLEEVLTTASKRGDAEAASDFAGAINVLDGENLAARHLIDIEDLSFALPNVAFDGIGTGKGIANFSIRGAGVAGSIPSIDPTVGVFVDGMYLGVNYGVIMDLLDLEAVEVLRGPQGLLFGRNVVGGAVLLRARRPSGERNAQGSLRLETGLEKRASGSLEGAFADDAIRGRIAASFRDDSGWFENQSSSRKSVGAETSWVFRPVVTFRIGDDLDVTAIIERGSSDGDGPASQNRYRYQGFDFEIDEPGFSKVNWRHGIIEANRKVGNGTLTNVFAARAMHHESLADVDSTNDPVFHLWAFTDQEQLSNELRYSGTLHSRWHVTTGVYAFAQTIDYRERRLIRRSWGRPFGGDQRHHTFGGFLSSDFELGDDWVASAGARYTVEKKSVDVATAGIASCDVVFLACTYDFADDDTWRNITPMFALQHWVGERTHFYGRWTRGFRSGGYNLRNTSPVGLPGPFDEEKQDAFEAGLKTQTAGFRFHLAAFHYKAYGLQRQVTTADPDQAAIQVTANTADATVQGLEIEAVTAIGDGCTLSASVGIAHGAYDRIRHDLDGDGTIVGDEKLALPRLAPLTFTVDGECRRQIDSYGSLIVRTSVAHRDDSEIAHNNTGVLDGGDMVNASLSFEPSNRMRITLYGRNLLNEVFRRSHFDLTGLVESTYSPLKEGRVIGLETNWKLR